jgi:hypothetical protein
VLDVVAAGEEEVLADGPGRALEETPAGPPEGPEI